MVGLKKVAGSKVFGKETRFFPNSRVLASERNWNNHIFSAFGAQKTWFLTDSTLSSYKPMG